MQPAKGMDAVGSVFTPALLKNMSGDTHVGGEIIILILPDRINTGFKNELMPPEVSSLRHLKNMSGDTHVGREIIILILPDRINTGFKNELMPPEVSSLRHLKNMSGDTHVGREGALKSAGFLRSLDF
jgi:hypothetical protein